MVKYALGYRVRKAYRAGDREALVVIADDFARTERLLKKFIKSFSARKGAEDGETLAFNDWLYTFAVKPGL